MTARAACVRLLSAGRRLLGRGLSARRRRPTPPRPRALLVRLLMFAGLCVTGSALLALLGAGSASAAPTAAPHVHTHVGRTPGEPAVHSDHAARPGEGLLDGVGRLASSALRPPTGPADARDHAAPVGHGSSRAEDGEGVVPSLVDSVLTGKGPNAESPKPPASHRPRSGRHHGTGHGAGHGADDGIGNTAVTGVTAADRAVASIAAAVHPVTAIVDRVAAPVRPVTTALTAPLAPVVGKVVTPLRPVTAPAGHLLTSTGLVPVPGGSAPPPRAGGAHQHKHRPAAGDAASVSVRHLTPGVVHPARVAVGSITTATAGGATAAGHDDAPGDQPAPFWPVGVTLPATGGSGSSNTMNSGAGGNATAGHAERAGAAPWPRVIGIAHYSDDLARQLHTDRPQVSPD